MISWNCLADSYAHGTTVGKLQGCKHIIEWTQRWKNISNIIKIYDADLVCLQEVDHYETHFKPLLESLRYQVSYVPRNERNDGVLIAFKFHKFHLVLKEEVQFDDLAEVKPPRLQTFMRFRLRKHNVGLVLVLRKKSFITGAEELFGQSFSISTAHLFWNPAAPKIKLAQSIYLLKRIAEIHETVAVPLQASILAGDFNSLPGSATYQRVLRGTPFSHVPGFKKEGATEEACRSLNTYRKPGKPIKFLCDSTLRRMVRYLRLVGINVTLEGDYSHKRRTKNNDMSPLFAQARKEQRVIVTTSTGITRRSACPEVFLVKPSSGSLESQVSKLLNFYDFDLKRSDLLTICGKCGGQIESCASDDPRLEGKIVLLDRQIYTCVKCNQPYWNEDSLQSLSNLALRQAEQIFACVEADRRKKLDRRRNLFPKKPSIADPTTSLPQYEEGGSLGASAEVLKHDRTTRSCWLGYRSAFFIANKHEPDQTNINGFFRGTLDYVFVSGLFEVHQALVAESNPSQEGLDRKADSFPNKNWPSDHMMLYVTLVLQQNPSRCSPFVRSKSFS